MLKEMLMLPFLMARFWLASPPRDQTEKDSVMEAATNWELTLVDILAEDRITW